MKKEPVYYRKTDIKKFEDFKDGEYICEVCNGWGYFYDCEDNRVSSCYHCNGIGKLDWITNVTGVAKTSNYGVASSAAYGFSGTSGTARPSTPPPPPKKRKIGAAGYQITKPNKLTKRTIPIARNKKIAVKKISWKEKFMNTVADK